MPVLVRVFNAAFQSVDTTAPLSPLLLGIVCLLHKPRQPDEEVSSCRSITLLNCDVKLVMLVMANRLQLPREYLIDISQSALLPGRDICDNLHYNMGRAARLTELGLPGWLFFENKTDPFYPRTPRARGAQGTSLASRQSKEGSRRRWLLHSDLTKAYGSVNRGWVTKVMRTMGPKNTGIVRWTSILLNSSMARVASTALSRRPSLSRSVWPKAVPPAACTGLSSCSPSSPT